MEKKVRYITSVEKTGISGHKELETAKKVAEKYAFRTTDYYLSLLDPNNPDDPLRKIALPNKEELEAGGYLDPSSEKTYTVAPGLEHKYEDTALFLVTDVCFGFCRFCFRKRLFMNDNDEKLKNYDKALEYIRNHKEIINVLLTGGDPLIMSTKRLEHIISELRKIDHVKNIRIGTKALAYNPYRITEDKDLTAMLSYYSDYDKRIYIINDINHPNEITAKTKEAADKLLKAGIILANQTPLLKGINDNAEVLNKLISELSAMGIPQYYVFVNRPVVGNSPFAVPVEEGWFIFKKAMDNLSGLERRARYVMSHKTGKIEILAVTEKHIIFTYHRAAQKDDYGKIMIYKRNPKAKWFDDYTNKVDEYKPDFYAAHEKTETKCLTC